MPAPHPLQDGSVPILPEDAPRIPREGQGRDATRRGRWGWLASISRLNASTAGSPSTVINYAPPDEGEDQETSTHERPFLDSSINLANPGVFPVNGC